MPRRPSGAIHPTRDARMAEHFARDDPEAAIAEFVGIMPERTRVLELLKKLSVKVAGENDPPFKLASGGESRFYVDVKRTALNREAHILLADLLYEMLTRGGFGSGIKAVAGVALGGCHLASSVAVYAAMEYDDFLNVAYVRKEAKDHGTKNLVEQTVTKPNEPVVLLEDVITTGGSSIRALQNLLEAGYDVRGTIAVIDRRAKEARTEDLGGFPFRALFTLDDFKKKDT